MSTGGQGEAYASPWPLLRRKKLAPQESRTPLSLLPRRRPRASAAFALWGPKLLAAGPAPQAYSDPSHETRSLAGRVAGPS